MTAAGSRALTLGALAGLAILLTVRLPAGLLQLIAVTPPVLLLLAGIRPPPRWGGWAAVVMIPYVCLTVMDTLTTPGSRLLSAAAALCSVTVFFAGFDLVRRQRVSLRR